MLLVVACFCAGTYGAFHNQISYTVSSEYFTEFKFHQFRIEAIPPRAGAAIVGWSAAWWMGIVIGVFLIPAGLVIRGNRQYFWAMIQVFLVVTVTTMLFGLGALGVAFLTLNANDVGEVSRYGNEIQNDLAFQRAGAMHNFSYLGGMAGIISGALYLYWLCCRQTTKQKLAEKIAAGVRD